jgi:WD40 repeat protein
MLTGGGVATLLLLSALGIYQLISKPQPSPVANPVSTEVTAPAATVAPVSITNTPFRSSNTPVGPRPTPAFTPESTAPPPEEDFFPKFPLLPGLQIPEPSSAIQQENLPALIEVARWGNPRIHQIAWSRDNSSLLGATSAGVYFYDANTLDPKKFFDAGGWLSRIDISADGSMIVTGDQTGRIALWDAKTGQRLQQLDGHSKAITSIDISPAGDRLVSASEDGFVKVWDLTSGVELYAARYHAAQVNSVLFSPNGQTIYSGAEDFKVILMSAAAGEQVDTLTSSARIYNMALSSTGNTLAVALREARVEIWDLAQKNILRVLSDPEQVKPVRTLSFSPNNLLLAVGWDDGMTAVWNVQSGVQIMKFNPAIDPEAPDRNDPVETVAFSNDGTSLVTQTQNGSVVVWDLNQQARRTAKYLGWVNPTRIDFSQHARWIAMELDKKEVAVHLAADARKVQTYPGVLPQGSAFSPDHKMLAVQSSDQIHLYNAGVADDRIVRVLYGYPVNARFGFLPSSDIAGGSTLRNLLLWSTTSGQQLDKENFKTELNCQAAYTAGGSFMAAGSNLGFFTSDTTTSFLCPKTLNLRGLDVAFVEGGDYAAVGLENGQIELWSIENGVPTYLKSDSGRVEAVALTPDSNLLLSGGADGKITIWDTSSGEISLVLENHTGRVNDIVVSADGKRFATCAEDGTVKIWAVIND